MSQKIGLRERIGYGFGDAASSMFWKLFSMYLLFFYTDIFGIPAAIIGKAIYEGKIRLEDLGDAELLTGN